MAIGLLCFLISVLGDVMLPELGRLFSLVEWGNYNKFSKNDLGDMGLAGIYSKLS
jgi:hypothetical protein